MVKNRCHRYGAVSPAFEPSRASGEAILMRGAITAEVDGELASL